MSADLRQGFILGPWTVEPLRGAVIGPHGEARHLEPKVMDVLVCLAGHGNELVTRAELLDSVWRAADVTDEPLTRAIGELRRALDDDRSRQTYIETVPKRGYRLVGEIHPLARKEAHAVSSQADSRERFSRRNLVFGIGVLVAIAAVSFFLILREPTFVSGDAADDSLQASTDSNSVSPRSVAVLPFRNRSAAEEDAYFVDGVHDDIVTQLAKIASIDKVISRTTMEKYRDTGKSIPEIGRELGVATVLEGGVQRSGEQVRINVQLIDAAGDQHLWAETYDRRMSAENIFAIQSEIAEAVAAALHLTLTASDQQRMRSIPTQNLDALENYFRGRERMAKRTTMAIDEAIAYLNTAIEMDPAFALAYVALARAIELKYFYAGSSYEDDLPRARKLVTRALELDGESGEAYAQLASLDTGIDNVAAEAAFRRAIELNPGNAVAYMGYCDLLGPWLGRNEEALPHCQRAVELDPLSPIRHTILGQTYAGLGRFDDAEAAFFKAVEIDPEFSYAYTNLGYLERYSKGKLHEAARWFREAIALDPGATGAMVSLGNTYLDLGDVKRAEFWIKQAVRIAPSSPDANLGMSFLHAIEGDYAAAADYARTAVANQLPEFAGYAMTPIRDYEMREGRLDRAREYYASAYPEMLASDDLQITPAERWPAVDFAFILTETGERDQAMRIMELVLGQLESAPRLSVHWGYAIADVHIFAILGNRDRALDSLQRAVDEGWRTFWWYELMLDLSLEAIRDDPRFESVVARIEADMAAQLAELREWEANGELAPIPPQLRAGSAGPR